MSTQSRRQFVFETLPSGLAALVLAACGGSSKEEPSVTATYQPILQPTIQPTSTPAVQGPTGPVVLGYTLSDIDKLENILRNGNFENGLQNWTSHNAVQTPYLEVVTDPELGKKAVRITPNKGANGASEGTSEFWQGDFPVSPGDLLIFDGYFKSGKVNPTPVRPFPNVGVGYGIDVRQVGNPLNLQGNDQYLILGTGNFTATKLEGKWVRMINGFIVPDKIVPDAAVDQKMYWMSEGTSGTDKGARAGRGDQLQKLGPLELPMQLRASAWAQIWHHDKVLEAHVADLRLYKVAKANIKV